MSVIPDLGGTSSSLFKIGVTGPQFKNSSGVIQARNFADSAFAEFAALQRPPAGTATDAPIVLTAGTNLTTPAAGAIEYDGEIFTSTPKASERGIIPSQQFVALASDFTLLNQTAAQNCLTAANDTLTVAANGTYKFDGFFIINCGSASHTTAIGFAGTATVTSCEYDAMAWVAALNTASTTQNTIHVSGVAQKVLTSASTAVYNLMKFSGIMRVTTAGTIIPQISFSAQPGGTNLMKVGSWISFARLGSNTVSTVGNWS